MSKTRSKKLKKSNELKGAKPPFSFKKHVMPPLAGILVMAALLGAFNSQLIAAAFIDTPIIENVDDFNVQLEAKPVDSTAPSRIIINNVAIEAPINFDQQKIDETQFQIALRSGVVHYPNTANPGEVGNVVIFGHSSSVWWAKGDYKFVFAPLHDLEQGNKIYVEYAGTRYIYRVTGSKVVSPDDVSVLEQTKEKRLTLITCTPVGSDTDRLIIEAEQIAPVYTTDESTPAPVHKSPRELEALPSTSPSIWSALGDLF